ncbi:MAG: class I SAM-dependent methyltransferase, partial [Thiohalocapsa sp.]
MCSPIQANLPRTTSNSSPEADPAAVFADRMLDILNSGALAIMTSVGHRTGLFDTLAELSADNGAASSAEIAIAGGLNERYVREWLAAMTTGGIVRFDPESGKYRLPEHHAVWLTRAASPDNLAVTAQFLPLVAGVEDDIVQCFHNGGGVPYERFRRFHDVMAEDSGQTVVAGLFEHILPLVPGLHQRLTDGIDVLDLGCGRGRALMAMARAYPASRFSGVDFNPEAIQWGQSEAERLCIENLVLEVRDAAKLDEDVAYDLVTTFDAIHDQGAPQQVLNGIRQALRSGGVYLMQDINGSSHVHNNLEHPLAPLMYTLSTMHC